MKKAFGAILTVFLIMPFTGCKKEDKAAAPKERVLNVKTEDARKIKLRPYVEAVGTLKAYDEVVVSSEVAGTLIKLLADEGAKVSKGKLLARIDDTDYKVEVERAEAALIQAEAALSSAKAEYKRKEALYKENLVTDQQIEAVSTALSLAESQQKIAKANLALSKQRLSKTDIRSPLDGYVKEKTASEGALIKQASPLFTIIKTDPMKVEFNLCEKDMVLVKAGQDIEFDVEAMPGKNFRAKVKKLYPALDEKTRTLKIEAESPNKDGALKAGLFARIRLYTGDAREMVFVPYTALLYEGEKTRIFALEGDAAKEKFVTAGIRHSIVGPEGTTELVEIRDGLKEGESVIVVGQQNLFDGAKVKAGKD